MSQETPFGPTTPDSKIILPSQELQPTEAILTDNEKIMGRAGDEAARASKMRQQGGIADAEKLMHLRQGIASGSPAPGSGDEALRERVARSVEAGMLFGDKNDGVYSQGEGLKGISLNLGEPVAPATAEFPHGEGEPSEEEAEGGLINLADLMRNG